MNAAWGSKDGVDSAGGSAGDADTTWRFRDGVEGPCGSAVVKLGIQLAFKHLSTRLAILLRGMDRWLQ